MCPRLRLAPGWTGAIALRATTTLLFALLIGCSASADPPETLVVLHDRDVESLDPHTAGGVWQTQTVLANMYEGLVALDRSMRVLPALASSWSNPDDLTLDLHLREGVAFHTGGQVEPEDVVFSVLRARDHPRSVLRAALANVADVSVLPGRCVRIRTRESDVSVVARLRDVYVVSRRFVEERGELALEAASAGTGPYRLAAHRAGVGVDLARFAAYWGGAADIPQARFLARSYGSADLDQHLGRGTRLVFFARPGTDLYQRARAEAELHESPGLGVSYLGFDLHGEETPGVTHPDGSHRNPFLDRRVREAVALALDHRRLDEESYGGKASVPTQLVPDVVLGFDPARAAPRQDVEAARALLRSTPFAAGFRVDLDLREMMGRYGARLKEDLAALGVEVNVRPWPEAQFFSRVSSGRSSLYVLRFSCRTGDAQEYFDKWVHSRDRDRGYGEFNYSYEQDPVEGLDAAIEAARRDGQSGRRLQRLRDIMGRVMEARLAVPLLQDRDVTFVSRDVEWTPRADTYRLVAQARFRRD